MIRAVAYILLLATAGLALLCASKSARGGARLSLALLALAVAALVFLLGMPALAVPILAILPLSSLLAIPGGDAPVPAPRLRSHVLPVLVAACVGLAAPALLDAGIETRKSPPPVEGASAARGGYGLWFALFERGLLIAACVVALALLLGLARGVARRAALREGGSS